MKTKIHYPNNNHPDPTSYPKPRMSRILWTLYSMGIPWLIAAPVLLLLNKPEPAFVFGVMGIGWTLGCTYARLLEIALNEKQ